MLNKKIVRKCDYKVIKYIKKLLLGIGINFL